MTKVCRNSIQLARCYQCTSTRFWARSPLCRVMKPSVGVADVGKMRFKGTGREQNCFGRGACETDFTSDYVTYVYLITENALILHNKLT
jgi:hypothetical protein